jgi:hypothetical protein
MQTQKLVSIAYIRQVATWQYSDVIKISGSKSNQSKAYPSNNTLAIN